MAINSKNMDSVETESFCSNSSSDFGNSCKPKDYTCSSLSNMKNNNESILENTNSVNGKIKLNFGVDRLLSKDSDSDDHAKSQISRNFLEKNIMFNINSNNNNSRVNNELGLNLLQYPGIYNNSNQNFVLKPFPLRIGNTQNGLDLHHHHQQRTHQHFLQSNNLRKIPISTSTNNSFPFNTTAFTSMLRLPNSIATNQNPQFNIFNNQKYLSDASKLNSQISPQNCETMSNNSNGVKRKRSWSRAVFSNLQRKGLERQFEVQKYITKPDRKKLAARLGLKDAQVKVWFQNRRMKWRHTSRNQNAQKIPNDGADLNDDLEKFTSDESSDEQDEIDVVSDK